MNTYKENTPFDFVDSIFETKENLMKRGRTDYNSFIVNKALSLYPDSLYPAYMMNLYPNLPHRLQYDFLLNIIQSRDRYRVRWPKPTENEYLKVIQEVYSYNVTRAKEVLSILSEDELRELVEYNQKYGKSRSRRT